MAPSTPPPLTGRQVLGKFVVDFVETFAGMAGAIIVASFVLPASFQDALTEGWAITALLVGPFVTSLLSAARHAGLWDFLKKWLLAGASSLLAVVR